MSSYNAAQQEHSVVEEAGECSVVEQVILNSKSQRQKKQQLKVTTTHALLWDSVATMLSGLHGHHVKHVQP